MKEKKGTLGWTSIIADIEETSLGKVQTLFCNNKLMKQKCPET